MVWTRWGATSLLLLVACEFSFERSWGDDSSTESSGGWDDEADGDDDDVVEFACDPPSFEAYASAWILYADALGLWRVDSRGALPLEPELVFAARPGQELTASADLQGRLVLLSQGDGPDELWRVDAHEPEELEPLELQLPPGVDVDGESLQLTPDGQRAAFFGTRASGAAAVYTTPLDPGEPMQLYAWSGPTASLSELEITPDESSMLILADLDASGVQRWHQLVLGDGPGAPLRSLGARLPDERDRLHDDQGQYVIITVDAGIYRVDLTGTEPTQPVQIDPSDSSGVPYELLLFNAEYDRLVYNASQYDHQATFALDLTGQDPEPIRLSVGLEGRSIASPSGVYLVTSGTDHGTIVSDMRTWPPSSLTMRGGPDAFPGFFADEQTFYSVDGDLLRGTDTLVRTTIQGSVATSQGVQRWDREFFNSMPDDVIPGHALLLDNLSGIDVVVGCEGARPRELVGSGYASAKVKAGYGTGKRLIQARKFNGFLEPSDYVLFEYDPARDSGGVIEVARPEEPLWVYLTTP